MVPADTAMSGDEVVSGSGLPKVNLNNPLDLLSGELLKCAREDVDKDVFSGGRLLGVETCNFPGASVCGADQTDWRDRPREDVFEDNVDMAGDVVYEGTEGVEISAVSSLNVNVSRSRHAE